MKLFDFLAGKSAPLIAEATGHVATMMKESHHMYRAATSCLLENEILTMDLEAVDKTVNDGEHAVRRLVLEHIAIDPDHELVFGLILLSIVQDAERLGDIAKTISEVASLASQKRHGTKVDELRLLRDDVDQMFEQTITGFVDGDVELTRNVMSGNQEHKIRREAFIRSVAEDGQIGENLAVVLALGARLIGRTSSHLSNIASGVAVPFDQLRS